MPLAHKEKVFSDSISMINLLMKKVKECFTQERLPVDDPVITRCLQLLQVRHMQSKTVPNYPTITLRRLLPNLVLKSKEKMFETKEVLSGLGVSEESVQKEEFELMKLICQNYIKN